MLIPLPEIFPHLPLARFHSSLSQIKAGPSPRSPSPTEQGRLCPVLPSCLISLLPPPRGPRTPPSSPLLSPRTQHETGHMCSLN